MPRFLSVTNSDTTSSILVASMIRAIVGLSIIIFLIKSDAKVLLFFENAKNNRQKYSFETNKKVMVTPHDAHISFFSYLCSINNKMNLYDET